MYMPMTGKQIDILKSRFNYPIDVFF